MIIVDDNDDDNDDDDDDDDDDDNIEKCELFLECPVTVYWPRWFQCIAHLQYQIHSPNDHINLAIQAKM